MKAPPSTATPAVAVNGLPDGQVYTALATSADGLSSAEAARRLREHGPNELAEAPRTHLVWRLLAELVHFFALLLWAAAGLAFLGGLPQLGWAIIAVILLNALFSFGQEYKAERALDALRQLLPAHATVLRDGAERSVLARDLVPGDVLVLAEGDRVSADARLVQAFSLRMEQAALTGESAPVPKTAGPQSGPPRPGDGANLVFAGATVASGSGVAVVFATGMRTEFGRVAHLTQQVGAGPTNLQRDLERATRIIGGLAVLIGAVFFGLGLVAGLPPLQGFLFAVGVIVALVPEGLLPTLTVALAIGVQRMARHNALVRRLLAVETLGSCTIICTDKTGTLTQNQMTVNVVLAAGREWAVSGAGYTPEGRWTSGGAVVTPGLDPVLDRAVRVAALCNNARLLPPDAERPRWSALGDPTEAALLVAARKAGCDEEVARQECSRIFELPFDSTRKRMTTVHRTGEGTVAYVKGAPAEVLERCTAVATADGEAPLNEAGRLQALAGYDRLARQGLRVLALAWRPEPPSEPDGGYYAEAVERDLVFLGLMAMQDPPRAGVAEAVAQARRAGIRLAMITGDYGLTAEAIGRTIGLVRGPAARVVSGAQIDGLSDQPLGDAAAAGDIIFARVSPEHKMRIVRILEERGETVAVTGDGVNDAPALKRADIGVAMGLAGSDVAKEAADIVLLDDNFSSIVTAIEQGRAVYDNIKKFVSYVFVSNVAELAPFVAMVFWGLPLPLTVLQVLAVDLGTDMLPALALGAEPPEPGVMDRAPRAAHEHLMDGFLLLRSLAFLGGLEAAGGMAGYFWVYWSNGWRPGLPLEGAGPVYQLATTMTLACIVAGQVGAALAVRTEQVSVFRIGLFSNRLLLGGIAVELALLAVLSYVPLLQGVFGTAPLRPEDWLLLPLCAAAVFTADEMRKAAVRSAARRRAA